MPASQTRNNCSGSDDWRLGRFVISEDILRSGGWRALLPLFEKVVVVRAFEHFDVGHIEYLAFSDMFEPIEMWRPAPLYEIQFSRAATGKVRCLGALRQ